MGPTALNTGNSPARVFREGGVIVIDHSGVRTEDDVFKDRSKSDGIEDIWLFFGRQIDAFCITLKHDQYIMNQSHRSCKGSPLLRY